MMSVGHVLDHVPDHVLDHMIIGLVTTALHISTVSRVSTPAYALPVVFVLSFVAQYSENNFQQILRTVLNSRPFVHPSALAPAPQQYKTLVRGLEKSDCQIYIRKKFTWSAITSFSIIKTILPPLGLKITISCHLPSYFSRILAYFACRNISKRWRMKLSFLSLKKNLKLSFGKAWVIPWPLLTPSGAQFGTTPSIS